MKLSSTIERFGERPFGRLVLLCCARIFRGGDSASGQLDFGVGATLAMLAAPGGFAAILLLDKYSTMMQWMRGQHNFDALTAAAPDEYFFIVVSMAISAAVAAWKWDSVFPDRRDYANLAPLPLTSTAIFRANLLAIAMLAGVFAIDVNAASSMLFPLIASASQASIVYYLCFAAVHISCVVLASVFSFAAVFAIAGALLATLPYGMFRRVSLYLRLLLLLAAMALLATSFAVPALVNALAHNPQSPVRWLPSVWFLGLVQMLHGRADASLAHLGYFALEATGVAIAVAIAAYGLSYRRSFVRAAETSDVPPISSGGALAGIFRLLDATLLRNAVQRGGYRFCLLTLVRNERHGLALGGMVGFGLIAASQTLFTAFNHRARASGAAPSAELLSIPLLLAFCAMVGLRVVFAMPAELKANWMFRFLLQRGPQAQVWLAGVEADSRECARLARNVMLTLVLPGVWLVALPVYGWFWGWKLALVHCVIVAVWCCLLAESLVARFRKMPFTCELPSFQQNTVAGVLACLGGAFLFIEVTSMIEYGALQRPGPLIALAVLGSIWAVLIRERRNDVVDRDRELQFDDAPANTYELLNLTEGG